MTINGVQQRSHQQRHDQFFQALAYACGETRRSFDRFSGMSQARRQILTLLSEQGEVSHAALARHLDVDGAAITRHVKGLEVEGAVSRRLDPDDNRYTLASLTLAGEELVAKLQATHQRYQAQVLAGISAREQEIVVRVLERLRANIRQEAGSMGG
jgi:DNA-binding MarR family transcriptional regulator